MYVAFLKKEIHTEKNDTTWPVGHPITKDGDIVVCSEPFMEDLCDWKPIVCLNPRFELVERKKENL